jgi:REP element-mobilizing transposase RayT
VSLPGLAYFITKCIDKAIGKALARSECAEVVAGSFLWARDEQWWRILGFVVMPDHYHLVVGLRSVKSLSDAMRSIDKFTGRRINTILGRSGPFWEDGFYEHVIRDRQDYDDVLRYVHGNPVQAGLTSAVDAWHYSTANERFTTEIDWEWLGPSLPTFIPCKYRFESGAIPRRYR